MGSSSPLEPQEEEGEDNKTSLLEEEEIPPEEWKKLITDENPMNTSREFEKVDIERFTTQWMEHPKIKDFIDWKDDSTKVGYTMLICAIQYERFDIADVLLKNGGGADPNIADKYGRTALMEACSKGHNETVKLLFDKGANLTPANKWGVTALMCASSGGHTETVKLLVEEGANVNSTNEKGSTPLMIASICRHPDTVQYLVENAGADTTITNNKGETALKLASDRGNKKIVDILLPIVLKDSETPMEWAKLVKRGSIRNLDIETFITKWMEHPQKESFIDWKDDQFELGKTVLLAAINQDRWDIAKALLKHGADVNITNARGDTALMGASFHKSTEIVQLLLEKGADVNITDNEGRTALIWASKPEDGNVDVAKLLIQNGANVHVKEHSGDSNGWNALRHASYEKNREMMRLLRENGARLEWMDTIRIWWRSWSCLPTTAKWSWMLED